MLSFQVWGHKLKYAVKAYTMQFQVYKFKFAYSSSQLQGHKLKSQLIKACKFKSASSIQVCKLKSANSKLLDLVQICRFKLTRLSLKVQVYKFKVSSLSMQLKFAS